MSRPRNPGTHAWAFAQKELTELDSDIAQLEARRQAIKDWMQGTQELDAEAQATKAQEHAPGMVEQEGQAPLEPTGDTGSPPERGEACEHGVPWGELCGKCIIPGFPDRTNGDGDRQ